MDWTKIISGLCPEHGDVTVLAKKLNVNIVTVSRWKHGTEMPHKFIQEKILKLHKIKGGKNEHNG